MFIRSIRLRDWKAYVDIAMEFPDPEPGKNVILIGAKNGFGKTSLLEAIVLGLFGRSGLPLIGRANFGTNSEDRLDVSYNEFLERAFHAQARDHGRTSMSVELTFLTDEGEQVRVQRIWYFSGAGRHRREDEEIRIWRGPDDELVTVPLLEDRDEFLRGYIAQHFLPVHLAQFFLFDGEQVQRLAKQDMSTQVRLGIEGILGVPILRELSDDLREYAKDRRRRLANVGDERIDGLRAELRDLEVQEERIEDELRKIAPDIEPLKTRRDELVKTIGSLRGGDYASLKQLFEDKEGFIRNLDKYKEELRRLLSYDVALATAGKALRDKTNSYSKCGFSYRHRPLQVSIDGHCDWRS